MMNIKIIKLLMFFAVIGIFGSTTLQAQEDEISTLIITGKVLNEKGEPFKQILVKSFTAKDKVITDNNGKFSIKVSSIKDQIIVDLKDYQANVTQVLEGKLDSQEIVLHRNLTMENTEVHLPYQSISNDRNVSSVYTITGDELASYPSGSFIESLSGRIPGLVIHTLSNNPVQEQSFATLRGEGVVFYIDGIKRDPSDLSVFEVKTVQVIKDFSGRAALGLTGVDPVIWITTKLGEKFQREISASVESGFSSATTEPKYLDSYNYAKLHNEALKNDGLQELYSTKDIEAYKDGTDPLYHSNIDYYKRYVTKAVPFVRANINFKGGDDIVNYFTLIDMTQSEGLESMGVNSKSNRLKLRGNVNIKLNDFIKFNVNIAGTYEKSKYPNIAGGADHFNIFDYISQYPSNAHAISLDNSYIVSNDYPLNLDNELKSAGYAQRANLNSQNTVSVLLDLKAITEGLTFKGTAGFDMFNNVTNSKGGTEALYELLPNNVLSEVQQKVVEPNLTTTADWFNRATTSIMSLNYDKTFGEHQLTMNASYLYRIEDFRATQANYQSVKNQDLSYRVNYTYNSKYVLQVDLPYTGSIKLPEGQKYSLYPTVGAAWLASNESFLKSSSVVDYLKFFASLGIMGNENFNSFGSYNPYYLSQTLWQANGGWASGIDGNRGNPVENYIIQQQGSLNYHLPEKQFVNVGFQSELFDKSLSVEANYFYQKDTDLMSLKSSYTPSIFGTDGFLPVTNFGSTEKWGLESYIQYKNKFGDLHYSIGGNVLYYKSKYIEVDEPLALDDYRKRAGTDADAFWAYSSEGLYKSNSEISSRDVPQSWGEVQPGDIRYNDYNNDGVVDEKDIHNTGAHAPRLFYGINLRLNYKGIGLYLLGQGQADGQVSVLSPYFSPTGNQNYSEIVLDRYSDTNTNGSLPRLSTQSANNGQNSTFWLKSASYFSLKNIELSYTLPKRLGKNLILADLTFYARAKNVFSFSELSKYNLEVENLSPSVYPIYKTFTFGASCKF